MPKSPDFSNPIWEMWVKSQPQICAIGADGGHGEQLSISPRTVEIHRASMLAKLGARHSSEGIRIAIEAGLAN